MREGSNSMTVCQPRVMMLVWPLHAELTSTMGPGSRKRRIWETGRSVLGEDFMRPSREPWGLDARSLAAFTLPAPSCLDASVRCAHPGITMSRDGPSRLAGPATLRRIDVV